MVGSRALILYQPTLHKGYLDLYARQGGKNVTLYLIGTSLLSDIPRAERDVSRIDPTTMREVLLALHLFKDVAVLEKDSLAIPESTITANDHSAVRSIMERYYPDRAVEYDTTFLRWDMPRALSSKAPDSSASVSRSKLDRQFMDMAKQSAERSPDWWRHVGALVAHNGKLLLPPAYNRHMPTDDIINDEGDPRSWLDAGEHLEIATAVHAEVSLIAAAAREGISLKGADLYVTVFPCPNCANLIAISGIKRLYYEGGYSLLHGQRVLEDAGVELIKVET